jgi:DNA-binding response OmpR family regulator
MNLMPTEVYARVLVVEDEPDLMDAFVDYLNMESTRAEGVKSLREAQAWMVANGFDVLILNLGLPDGRPLKLPLETAHRVGYAFTAGIHMQGQ